MISLAQAGPSHDHPGNGHDSSRDSNMGQSTNLSPLIVNLVVATGTHEGVAATIKEGIYMIGRDRECQIRPKSQSVSERHCLVQHQADVVRAFDLDSEEGTFINDQRLPPKAWHILNHGDRLRCGKYSFVVMIYLRESSDLASQEHASGEMEIEATRTPARSQQPNHVAPAHTRLSGARPSDAEVADGDLDDFVFENFDDSASHSLTADAASTGDLLTTKSPTETEPATPSESATKPAKSRAPLPKPKISHRSAPRFSGFSIDFGGPDAWKVWVACIALVATIGYASWSVYKVKYGTPVKILRGID